MKKVLILSIAVILCSVFVVHSQTSVPGGNPPPGACPVTDWKLESKEFKKSFKKDSETEIPGVKVQQDGEILTSFTWQERAMGAGNDKKINKLKNPTLSYGRASVKVDWISAGVTLNLLVALEGHSSVDFMRIDEVKVGEAEFRDAQNMPNAPKNTTVVSGATVIWAWYKKSAALAHPTEPITTSIQKEGSEIELAHISTEVEVEAVTQTDGSQAFVLDESNNILYPGSFASRLEMNHNVKVNCP
jgi:hypothetical protein